MQQNVHPYLMITLLGYFVVENEYIMNSVSNRNFVQKIELNFYSFLLFSNVRVIRQLMDIHVHVSTYM